MDRPLAKPAHTILLLPDHYDSEQAYYRKHFMQSPRFIGGVPQVPTTKVYPALEIHVSREPSLFVQALWGVALVGAFLSAYFLLHIFFGDSVAIFTKN